MRPVSDRWDVSESHRVVSRLTLLDNGEETDFTTSTVDGVVNLDQGAAIRGRCDVVFVDDGDLGIVPTDATDVLAPYGNEIRIERGLRYPDGEEEYVSLGIFRIDESTAEDSGDGATVRVSGLDRFSRIIDGRFEEAYAVASGTLHTTAILGAVQAIWPDVPYHFASSSLTTGALMAAAGEDRGAFIQTDATSMGMELYFDGDGVLILRPVPTAIESQRVAEIVDGENGVLTSASRRWTRQGTYNRVVALGETTEEGVAPVKGVATDDNPLSPTYYYGPFGRVPAFYVSEFITTTAQAQDAAAGQLAKQLGTARQTSFGSIVNPALEPGDVVRIRDEALDLDEDHVIDSLTIPLSEDQLATGSTRIVQVLS